MVSLLNHEDEVATLSNRLILSLSKDEAVDGYQDVVALRAAGHAAVSDPAFRWPRRGK
jgi:hypothetical protein